MNKVLTKFFILLVSHVLGQSVDMGSLPDIQENHCSSYQMADYYKNHSEAQKERDDLEAFTKAFVLRKTNLQNNRVAAGTPKYRIPVVFHVYGGPTHNFWGKTVDKNIIEAALAEANNDFQGLNDDFNTVHNSFLNIRGTLDVSFELAKKKPDGSVTDGIDWKTTTGAGYAKLDDASIDAQIAADAWDNKKYLNIYIVADLFNDGTRTNSGFTTYPYTGYTNSNISKVVYNGQYLGANTGKEFRSTFSHELAHGLNLLHTFENGCNSNGDNVDDTPPVSNNNLTCHSSNTATTPLSTCTGSPLVNVENYMDYSGRFDCYKMFTKGQINRMSAALEANNVTLRPLWQVDNLIATGLSTVTAENIVVLDNSIYVYPNPVNGYMIVDNSKNEFNNYEIYNVDGARIYSNALNNEINKIDLSFIEKGIYLFKVFNNEKVEVVKIVKE